jgi:hypothetical protein
MGEIEEKEEIRREEVEPDLSAVYTGSQAIAKAPELYGVATGIEGLDDLFFHSKVGRQKVGKGLPQRHTILFCYEPYGGFRHGQIFNGRTIYRFPCKQRR